MSLLRHNNKKKIKTATNQKACFSQLKQYNVTIV